MTRRFPNKKMTVEECRSLEINYLKKQGFLKEGPLFRRYTIRWGIDGQDMGIFGLTVGLSMHGLLPGRRNLLEFNYVITDPETGEKANCSYRADLVSTPCRFGGQRWWFICPMMNCDRRVGVLYLPFGAKYFACRHCYHLTYESVQTHDKRIDYLIKHPEKLKDILEGRNPGKEYLVMRATAKAIVSSK